MWYSTFITCTRCVCCAAADVGDVDNTRALFERVLTEEANRKSVLLWERYLQFEFEMGDLQSALRLEKRARWVPAAGSFLSCQLKGLQHKGCPGRCMYTCVGTLPECCTYCFILLDWSGVPRGQLQQSWLRGGSMAIAPSWSLDGVVQQSCPSLHCVVA